MLISGSRGWWEFTPRACAGWKRLWEQGGSQALRRRPATGRPPKLDDNQVEAVRAALEQGAQAHSGSKPSCGSWNGLASWLSG